MPEGGVLGPLEPLGQFRMWQRKEVRRYRVAGFFRAMGRFTAGFRVEAFFEAVFVVDAFFTAAFFAVVAFFAAVLRVDVFFAFAEVAFFEGAVPPPVSAFVQRWM